MDKNGIERYVRYIYNGYDKEVSDSAMKEILLLIPQDAAEAVIFEIVEKYIAEHEGI